MTDVPAQKSVVRGSMRAGLAATSSADRAAWSKNICQRLIALAEVGNARGVMLFLPMRLEVNLFMLASWLWAGSRRVFVPGINMQEGTLWPTQLAPETEPWEPSPRLTQVSGPRAAGEAVDVVIVPGLAFDTAGRRLGRGAGFYDRWLAGPGQRAFRVGVGFELQVLPEVPAEGHDRSLDAMVTESLLRRFEHSGAAR